MLSKQYTLTCHLPGHPSYSLVNQGPPERNLRKYVAREYKENIEIFIPRGGLNQTNLKLGTKSIHTVEVRSAISNYSTNPISANRPPAIDGSEQELPRRTRAILAPELILKFKTSALIVEHPLMMIIICSTAPENRQH